MADFQTVHEWGGGVPITQSIVEALAAAQGRDPTDLDPVYGAVDLEGIEQVVTSVREATDTDDAGHIEFAFDGYRVTVAFDGTISVTSDAEDGS